MLMLKSRSKRAVGVQTEGQPVERRRGGSWMRDAIQDPARNVLATIVVTTFVLGMLANGASGLVLESVGSWVEGRYGLAKVWFQLMVVLGLVGVLFVGLYFTSVADWLQRQWWDRDRLLPPNVEEMKWGFPGLVVAVSTRRDGPTPAEEAILWHWQRGALKHCWMICTEQSESEAMAIVARMEALGAPSGMFHFGEQHLLWDRSGGGALSLMLTAVDMDDPNYVRLLVDRIYGEAGVFGLAESEMVVDYTGGTKSMTAGMMLACVSPGRNLQYFGQLSKQLMLIRTAYRLKGK